MISVHIKDSGVSKEAPEDWILSPIHYIPHVTYLQLPPHPAVLV